MTKSEIRLIARTLRAARVDEQCRREIADRLAFELTMNDASFDYEAFVELAVGVEPVVETKALEEALDPQLHRARAQVAELERLIHDPKTSRMERKRARGRLAYWRRKVRSLSPAELIIYG